MHHAVFFSLALMKALLFLNGIDFRLPYTEMNLIQVRTVANFYFCCTPVDTMKKTCDWGHVLRFGRTPNFVAFFSLSLTHKAPDA